MKLLFINSRSPDYLEDLLFRGLTEQLGAERVVAAPANPAYYLDRRGYPRNLGTCRSPLSWFGDRLLLKSRLKGADFDAVVIGSTKRDTFEQYLALEPLLPKRMPVVYVDGGDRPEIGGDASRMQFDALWDQVSGTRPLRVIFKREYATDRTYGKEVHPLPMAFVPQPMRRQPRRYDVTLWCVESHEVRAQALDLLEGRYDCRANGTVRGQTFKGYSRKGVRYLEELSASRIACNFRGVGWDTMRYWEIPGIGSFMLSQRPQIHITDNFRHGEHVAFCRDDLSDMLPLLDYYLANSGEREDMARAAAKHAQRYHTYVQRSAFFTSVLEQAL